MTRTFLTRARRLAVASATLVLIATMTLGSYGSPDEVTPVAAQRHGVSNGEFPLPDKGRGGGKASVLPPKANGIWLYDTVHPGLDFSDRVKLPGMWAPQINRYNRQAAFGHKITRIYSYGSSMEMYCPDRNPERCTLDDLMIYYSPESSEYASTRAYANEIERVSGPEVVISPTVDGRIGAPYFSGFNELSPELARQFADKVTRQLCADPRIDGVQFDLEPFDVSSKNGQYYFYLQIAKNFAGENEGENFHCVGSGHPKGRFFSIFAFAEVIRAETASAEHVAEILTRFENGYMIQSLYDLVHSPAGTLNPAPLYAQQAQQAVKNMKTWANELDIPYSIGIPAAATAHEYSACYGSTCEAAPNGETGYPMIEYTTAAIGAINNHDVRSDSLFMGVDVWYLGSSHYRDGHMRQPVPVPTQGWNYLANNL